MILKRVKVKSTKRTRKQKRKKLTRNGIEKTQKKPEIINRRRGSDH